MEGTVLDLTVKDHLMAQFCTTPQNASPAPIALKTQGLRSEQGKFPLVLDTQELVTFVT